VHSAAVNSRLPGSFVPRRVAFVALAAIACLVLGACSPGADYPSLFPAVHDIPPPRSDTPLDRNQVQQATEDLISARDRLSAEAQGAAGKNATSPAKPAAKSPGDTAGKSAGKSAAKSAAKSSANPPIAAAAVKKPASNQVKGQQTPGPDAEQTAGSETK
jgi:hypothetical protein